MAPQRREWWLQSWRRLHNSTRLLRRHAVYYQPVPPIRGSLMSIRSRRSLNVKNIRFPCRSLTPPARNTGPIQLMLSSRLHGVSMSGPIASQTWRYGAPADCRSRFSSGQTTKHERVSMAMNHPQLLEVLKTLKAAYQIGVVAQQGFSTFDDMA